MNKRADNSSSRTTHNRLEHFYNTHLFTNHSQSLSTMCYWRRVRNVFVRCGHGINLPDEMIYCESSRCKFSPNHPASCSMPTCKQTCCQYRQYPQQYSPNINRFCPTCEQAGHR